MEAIATALGHGIILTEVLLLKHAFNALKYMCYAEEHSMSGLYRNAHRNRGIRPKVIHYPRIILPLSQDHASARVARIKPSYPKGFTRPFDSRL